MKDDSAEQARRSARAAYAFHVIASIFLAGFAGVLVLGFLGRIRTLTTIVLGAVFFSYLIYPAVRSLNRRLPMWASLLTVYFAFGCVLIAGFAVIVPMVSQNFQQLAHDTPRLIQNARITLADPSNPIIAHLPPQATAYLANLPAEAMLLVERYGGATTTHVLAFMLSAASIVVLFVIIPVFAAYMILDAQRIHDSILAIVPPAHRPLVVKIVNDFDTVLGGFVRGQLTVAAIVGVLVTIMLLILHVHYAVLIGLVAGLFEIMPYVGAIAGAIPAVAIALFSNGWQNALFVVIGFVVINQIEGHFISPFVVSESVGLSPFFVFLALLAGGELLGIPGLLLAVPVAGLIRVLIVNLVPQHR
ncbi:MAG: AI-2E family transporter [Vulcanimicrobiaceae bacterium]